ncbi:MAG: hypothetical protein I3274_03555 [Candidatus Moeniiplasma glomeromycotorum]|nr:hypothetical protein [Candidatus Moeniiplasma glomeromycotorum]
MTNLWQQLETKKISSRQEIEQYLTQKLGTPLNEIQTNLLFELTKKITSYYQTPQSLNYTIYTLLGSLTSPEQIQEKKFKEGKRLGQTYYNLNLGTDKLQALQENLPAEKWQQLTKLAILNQNLAFKYKKWITNKQLLDWQPQ